MIPGTGVDLNIFKPAPTFSLNNNKTVLMVSRLLKEKGIEILDDAAGYVLKKHKNINFLVAGEIDESSPSSYKFSDLEKFKNLNFLGRQSDVHNTMSKADIFVHPTYYREGFPRVLMEASASGLPIITTDIQGCRDAIINRVTGLIVPPKNSKVLADAIISLINNCTLRNKLGFNARAHAEIYFAEDILSKKHVNATLGIIQI